ncbi:N-acetylmuramoyl-L-alanine amidase [Streptomyces sp. NEAU-174]|uniref:N-acetylmuramoyl-L-alanine amidase n=1 Tax=Streptomyces sp. NEAU-174 TaxID=3458254 RepID=UPI0040444151
MATPLTAAQALTALKAEGCKVVEYRDWRTHNREGHGAWGPVHGVMIHHTVTSGTDSSVALCYDGHASLPGPLCHTVGAKDGRLFMVGWGRANHAGLGDDDVLQAVIDERALPPDNEANTDGNRAFYGIELINLGNGKDPWPEAQVDAAARWAAALCRKHGWSERSVIGHKEWQPGKIDPTFDMGDFRARVRVLLAKTPGSSTPAPTTPKTPTPQQQEESDVPSTLGLYNTTDRPLVPGKWTTMTVDKTDIVTGAKAYTASVMLTIDGASAGGTLQGRFYHQRTDGSRWDSGIVERPTTAGTTFADFPHAGSIAASEKLRFEVAYFPATSGDEKSVTITTSRVRGLYWK